MHKPVDVKSIKTYGTMPAEYQSNAQLRGQLPKVCQVEKIDGGPCQVPLTLSAERLAPNPGHTRPSGICQRNIDLRVCDNCLHHPLLLYHESDSGERKGELWKYCQQRGRFCKASAFGLNTRWSAAKPWQLAGSCHVHMKKRKDKQVDCCSPCCDSPTHRRRRAKSSLAPPQPIRKSTRPRRAKPLYSYETENSGLTSDADWEMTRPQSRRRHALRRSDAGSDMELTSPPLQEEVTGSAGGSVGNGSGGATCTNTAVTTPIVSPTPSLFQTRIVKMEDTSKLSSPFKTPFVKVEDKGVGCITGSDATEVVDGSSPITTAAGGVATSLAWADPQTTWPQYLSPWGYGYYPGYPSPTMDMGQGQGYPASGTTYFAPNLVVTKQPAPHVQQMFGGTTNTSWPVNVGDGDQGFNNSLLNSSVLNGADSDMLVPGTATAADLTVDHIALGGISEAATKLGGIKEEPTEVIPRVGEVHNTSSDVQSETRGGQVALEKVGASPRDSSDDIMSSLWLEQGEDYWTGAVSPLHFDWLKED